MPILGVIASSITGGLGGAGYFESIATVNGDGTSATVTFNSIPQTYSHLQIRVLARTTGNFNWGGTDTYIRINNDSSSTYYYNRVYGNGSTSYADQSATGLVLPTPGTSFEANNFASAIIDILDYTSTNKTRTIRSIYGGTTSSSPTTGGTGQIITQYSATTTAITRLDFVLSSGNFATGSKFALYGIKTV